MPRGPRRTARSRTRTTRAGQGALKRLGLRLRALRDARELTQEKAAEAAGMDPKHLQDVEAGRTNPTVTTLVAIAKAYEVTLAELFDGV